jgi:hypothetical protein
MPLTLFGRAARPFETLFARLAPVPSSTLPVRRPYTVSAG